MEGNPLFKYTSIYQWKVVEKLAVLGDQLSLTPPDKDRDRFKQKKKA